jgi:hypothetical protein
MSFLDSMLGQVGGNLDIAGIAAKFGIDPAVAQQAVAALASAHGQPGDTVDTAAAQTGLDSGMLGQIASHLGGAESLGALSQLVQGHPEAQGILGAFTGQGGEGAASGVLGMAKGLFGQS